jgi:hypothetical protein
MLGQVAAVLASWAGQLGGHWAQMLALSVGVQWVAWAVAAFFQTEKFYDRVGGWPGSSAKHGFH